MWTRAKYFISSARNIEFRIVPSRMASLLLGATAAAVPILFLANRFRFDAEAGQLGSLAQGALDLGESREARERDDVVPQFDGVVGGGQPADHRAEKRCSAGRLKVQDRRADVATRQRECFLGLRP